MRQRSHLDLQLPSEMGIEGAGQKGRQDNKRQRALRGPTDKCFLCWFITGHVAALNMLKKGKELHTVPFFWTTMLGKSIRYAGRKGQRAGNSRTASQPTCPPTSWVWTLSTQSGCRVDLKQLKFRTGCRGGFVSPVSELWACRLPRALVLC